MGKGGKGIVPKLMEQSMHNIQQESKGGGECYGSRRPY